MKFVQRAALVGAGTGVAWAAARIWSTKSYDLTHKVVLITGGSRGLGLVLARHFGAAGAKVAIVARSGADLADAERDLRERGVDVLAFPADVRVQAEATSAVERTVNHFGRVDILINNAGVIQVGPLEHMQVGDFENAVATHMFGPLYMILAAVPHMRQQGGGRIANIASVGGRLAVPHLMPYSASKFGLVGLSDGMRAELAKDNIQVTTVAPGLMRAGSHVNAEFKGNHQVEYAWFSIFDSLPLVSIDVDRAARQIIGAVRRGAPSLTITLQAKLAAAASVLAPGLVATVTKLAGAVLPAYSGPEGDITRSGLESESVVAPSVLTALNDRAAERNNEL